MQSGAAAAARAAAKEGAQKKKLMAMMGSAKKSTDQHAMVQELSALEQAVKEPPVHAVRQEKVCDLCISHGVTHTRTCDATHNASLALNTRMRMCIPSYAHGWVRVCVLSSRVARCARAYVRQSPSCAPGW